MTVIDYRLEFADGSVAAARGHADGVTPCQWHVAQPRGGFDATLHFDAEAWDDCEAARYTSNNPPIRRLVVHECAQEQQIP